MRTSFGLLCVLALLLLLNIIIPQASVQGGEVTARLAERSRVAAFFLDTLGLSSLPTSPVFVAVLALFFLNLAAVLVHRAGPTVRRTRLRPPTRATIDGWEARARSLQGRAERPLSAERVLTVLRGFGYRAVTVDEDAVWGVKHRSAPLGFLVFHISFFLLCLGGVGLYYSRFVGTVVLVEGQAFTGDFASVSRMPPVGGAPALRFALESVDARFQDGEPVHLGAELRLADVGGDQRRSVRVNHPVRVGASSILINRAGLAPELWLQDAHGFTVDRVAVVATTRAGDGTAVPLGGEGMECVIAPLAPEQSFPGREDLAATEVEVVVRQGAQELYRGPMVEHRPVPVGDGYLVLDDLRYWAGFTVVYERGGGVLIAGFLVATVGLVWRLLCYRREVAVTWRGGGFTVAGRAEYFSNAFVAEMEQMRGYLSAAENPQGD